GLSLYLFHLLLILLLQEIPGSKGSCPQRQHSCQDKQKHFHPTLHIPSPTLLIIPLFSTSRQCAGPSLLPLQTEGKFPFRLVHPGQDLLLLLIKEKPFVVAVVAGTVILPQKLDAVPVAVKIGHKHHHLLAVPEGLLQEGKCMLQRLFGLLCR